MKQILMIFLMTLNFAVFCYNIRDIDGNNGDDDENGEVKYVNSGQSILLVCDLPNNMPDGQVLFIKSDNKIISVGTDIREDGDEQRFEVNQQYAWEWSLKINSINEDDSGVYYCKVDSLIIKQYRIIVRVPPRIRDDLIDVNNRVYNEGDTVKLSCYANGTPKPNITWFAVNERSQTLKQIQQQAMQTQNVVVLRNITRKTPRYYQCRASNGIPPNDNRNFTFKINFAPEVEIKSKYDSHLNEYQLNCTINAYPLVNKNSFWRKDGSFLKSDDLKLKIETIQLNDHTIVSMLRIKYFEDKDKGLYECTGENDLRVSKVIFNLNGIPSQQLPVQDVQQQQTQNSIPIASIKNIQHQDQQFVTKYYRNRKNKHTTTTTASTTTTTTSFVYKSKILTVLGEDDYTGQQLEDQYDYDQILYKKKSKNLRNQNNTTSALYYRFNDDTYNVYSSSASCLNFFNYYYFYEILILLVYFKIC